MAVEDVDVVARCVRVLNERNVAAIPEAFDPEIVLDLSRNVFNPDVYRGYEGLGRYVASVTDAWDRFEAEVEAVAHVGDAVVTTVRVSAVGHSSGVAVDMQLCQVWKLRDGRALHITGGYRDRDAAFEAAGASGRSGS